jgi:adenine deaminase
MMSAIEGNVVDVRDKRVYPGKIDHEGGVITSVEETTGEYSGYLVPGFLDSHVHIESSLLCPSRFAEAVVPHGTTAVITDPHEIANVLGIPGIDYMRKDSKTVPLRVYFTAPSCVPATPFETSGAVIGPSETEELLLREDVVALGEMMNFPGVISGDPEVLAKLDAAKKVGKPVDGHCPVLAGDDLKKYIAAGISTDHECVTAEEAYEKHRLGMRIMVRQGSASRNLRALAPFAKENEFLLVSDDKTASDLLEGHVDMMLAEAVSLGIDPLHALRAATLNPAEHYRLPLGAIEPGRMADIVRVSDLQSFRAEEVFIGGELVAKDSLGRFEVRPKEMVSEMILQRKVPSDFELLAHGEKVSARVIGVVRDEIVTDSLAATLPVQNGHVMPDLADDVVRISVVNRYRDAPVKNSFVKGFGLKSGAIASSVSHDSHNIIVVGVSSEDMAVAANTLATEGGGFCACSDGKCSMLKLHVAGLLCTKRVHDVKVSLDQIQDRARELGCVLHTPFMTMSFLSLLVVPHLKIGDRGLFDVDRFEFVDPLRESQ